MKSGDCQMIIHLLHPHTHENGQRLPRNLVWGGSKMPAKKNNTDKTFSEKIGQGPRKLVKVMHKGREKISDWEIADTAHWRELRTDGKFDAKKVRTWLKENSLTGVKWSGVVTLWMAEMLTRLLNALFLDNTALRGLENTFRNQEIKKPKDKWYSKVNTAAKKSTKNHPVLASYLLYYLLLFGVTFGGTTAIDGFVDEKKDKRKKIENVEPKMAEAQTFAEYLDRMQGAMPYLVADLIAKEGVRVNEQGMHVPYRDGQGVWTIGFGSTVLKGGENRVTAKTPAITDREAYELACWHIMEHETLFRLWCYDVMYNDVDIDRSNELIALSASTYNLGTDLIEMPTVNGKRNRNYQERFAELDRLRQQYGNAITADQVRAVFAKYPVEHLTSVGKAWLNGGSNADVADSLGNFLKGGNGLRWRRWLEAQVMKGNIKPEVFLKVPVGGLYEFYKIVGEERENWFIDKDGKRVANDETLNKFNQWLENPVDKKGNPLVGAKWKPVSDYLPDDIARQCFEGKCEIGKPVISFNALQGVVENQDIGQPAIKTYVIGYEQLYADAIGSYKAGDYEAAAQKYQDMIKEYPDNALLRNDLAATYNKLGMYEEAIVQAREIVRRIGDKSQYGAALYNAGFAYEQLGNLEKALANYKLALANGNRRVQKDVTRVTEKMQGRGNKKVAFNSGTRQIRQKNARKDLLLYGQEYKGNMA